MTYLSIKKSIVLIFIAALTTGSIKAQIATPEGEMQGGNRKDTSHFVDKPSMHVHEQTIVIEEKGAKKNKQGKSEAVNGNNQAIDSSQQAHNATTPNSPADSISGMNRSEGNGNVDMSAPTTSTTIMDGNNTTPIYTALTIFGIGALIGLFLLVMILRGNKTSRLMALVHGALGLVGIGILIAYSMFFPGLVVSVVILAIAATGGIIVFYQDISNQTIPKWLVITHAVVAVAGIVTLVLYAIK